MTEQKTPPPSMLGSSGSAAGGHEVRLTRVNPQVQAGLMSGLSMKLPQLNNANGKQIKPLAASLDQLLNQYPEARQTRATIPCPACGTEIPIPHGSLQGYVAHMKSTAPEGDYRLDIRLTCKIQANAGS